MIYLASVYSLNADEALMQQRFEFVERVAAHFIEKGYPIFSPIVHGHEMAKKYKLPKDFDFWRNLDFNYLESSDELWVLTMEGWRESKGITEEIAHAKENRIPIRYVPVQDFV